MTNGTYLDCPSSKLTKIGDSINLLVITQQINTTARIRVESGNFEITQNPNKTPLENQAIHCYQTGDCELFFLIECEEVVGEVCFSGYVLTRVAHEKYLLKESSEMEISTDFAKMTVFEQKNKFEFFNGNINKVGFEIEF